jgi:hypothetical protein
MTRINLDEFVESIAKQCGLYREEDNYFSDIAFGECAITHDELKDFIIEKFMEFAKNRKKYQELKTRID